MCHGAERGTAEARVSLSGKEKEGKDTGEMVYVDPAQGETRIVRKGAGFEHLAACFSFSKSNLCFFIFVLGWECK